MPNLVGIGLSQVPTNSMLGGMAYQDPDRVKIKKLHVDEISQILGETSDDATDIFIYDTSKDSDGGAWRHRTQHLSWYNETLGTEYRGTRREFPSVAVLVVINSTDEIVIYDGDDPNLSMWMRFKKVGSGRNYMYGTGDPNCIAMVNGAFVTGAQASNFWPIYVDFLRDECIGFRISGGHMFHGANIAGRNTTSSSSALYWSNARRSVNHWYMQNHILNQKVESVAMTVLPNAPVDEITGLARPTILLGSDAGLSIVKDNGTVTTRAQSWRSDGYVAEVEFDKKHGGYWYSTAYYSESSGSYPNHGLVYGYENDLDNTDTLTQGNGDYQGRIHLSQGSKRDRSVGLWTDNHIPDVWLVKSNNRANGGKASFTTQGEHFGSQYGLTLFDGNYISNSTNTSSMGCYITGDFNTGWFHGSTQGIYLASTESGTVSGGDLITNGNLDTNTSGWSASTSGNGTTISRHVDGGGNTSLRVQSDTSTYGSAVQAVALQSNTTYMLSFYLRSTGGTTAYYARSGYTTDPNSSYESNIHGDNRTTSGHFNTYTFTTGSLSGTQYLKLASRNDGTDFRYDNIMLTKIENDRSTNEKNLHVIGSLTKTPVATGAELVGYSGYSSSNYLIQPKVQASPGTGDFSVTFWIKPGTLNVGTGSYVHIFSLGTPTIGGQGSSTGFVVKMTTHTGGNTEGYSPYIYNGDGGNNHGTYDVNAEPLRLGMWSQCIAMRRNGVAYMYINGVLIKTGNAWTTNLTDSYATIFRGIGYNEFGGDAQVALLRYSTSAPTTEQVKKMYADEKVLFEENAKCTLYSTTDYVKDLEYDEKTSLLHVGTVSGRSDFQGLRRINNTTTAVTTAISAHDGFIVEQ